MHDNCILQIGFHHLGFISLKIYNKSVFQISDTWALTASHCFFDALGKIDMTEEDFSLVIGLHDRTTVTDELR